MAKCLPAFMLAVMFFSPVVQIAHGSVVEIFGNDITGTNPGLSNPFTTGQTVDGSITVSGIGRGSGVNGASANDRYNANSWNTVSLDTNAYFTFTLTPNAGQQIDFFDFTYTGQASGTGPTSFIFRSSIDGFTSNLGGPLATGATISLTDASFQSITSAIEFRLYGFGATSSAGTFSVNDFAFQGTVSAVPEPTSLLLFGMAFASGLGFKLSRRKVAPVPSGEFDQDGL